MCLTKVAQNERRRVPRGGKKEDRQDESEDSDVSDSDLEDDNGGGSEFDGDQATDDSENDPHSVEEDVEDQYETNDTTQVP